jgi:hypothetical protein
MPDGVVRKFAEATALRDTPNNRERVMRQAEMIGAEIRGGAFDYLKWFPSGNRAAEYLVANGAPPQQAKVAPSDRAPVLRRMDRAENCAIRARVRRTRLPQPFPGLYPRCAGRRDA